MPVFPSVFVSHGAPTLVLENSAGRDFLATLGTRLGRPSAILAVSAHWTTRVPAVSGASRPETVHDFHGFPDALYRLRYPAPGAPALAERVAGLTGAVVDPTQGLDHGAWVPLMLMYPEADIPVAQFAVQPGRGAAEHIALGHRLAELRQEGVLVLASGGAVHNLREFVYGGGRTAPWASGFADWLDATLTAGDGDAVADWLSRCPDARRAHPTDEHFLPLPVALGAAGERFRAERLHAGFEHGSLGMQAYAFTNPADGAMEGLGQEAAPAA
ncbi:DODA-type extradiol aromatic ring-opening family dioxygenase [Azospirillum agricola]|uniref:DODA-type extradiol aromatic ring-opening family dioxygenase n=1 Tax=Azospirillum agricola TaxID=1720247 RepID=UPI000A0EFE71|nr:class III extradiol ring-cleavage dioxygenase [Azospirillum agricola]SMH59169.1 Aromatic ring-opening dioxygenase, catalytic subunit, LigB family [Azospirillum lipoferum]